MGRPRPQARGKKHRHRQVGGFPDIDAQWEDGKARVTGVVLRMTAKDIEREIGWVVPAELESKFRGRPALIVRSVERLAK